MTCKPSTAILLAAGKGTRMGSGVRKQYMMLCGQPLLAYSLRTLTDPRICTGRERALRLGLSWN